MIAPKLLNMLTVTTFIVIADSLIVSVNVAERMGKPAVMPTLPVLLSLSRIGVNWIVRGLPIPRHPNFNGLVRRLADNINHPRIVGPDISPANRPDDISLLQSGLLRRQSLYDAVDQQMLGLACSTPFIWINAANSTNAKMKFIIGPAAIAMARCPTVLLPN